MPYRIAGIDVHKKMLAVAVAAQILVVLDMRPPPVEIIGMKTPPAPGM